MQGIFQKENTDKALKYGIYRHLPIYEKIIRNLVSFFVKKIILFATSGGSGFGNTMRELQPSAPNSVIEEGRIFNNATRQQIMKWVETL
ncbi:hypothetical protein MKC56_14430 [[Clostridium] innocuum]|nr:hypothetical protein [[Clostridium] innocuum]